MCSFLIYDNQSIHHELIFQQQGYLFQSLTSGPLLSNGLLVECQLLLPVSSARLVFANSVPGHVEFPVEERILWVRTYHL